MTLRYGGNNLYDIGTIEVSGKIDGGAASRTYYYGNNMGYYVPKSVVWPVNIYYVWPAPLLSVARTIASTDSSVIYSLDTALYYQPAFDVLNTFHEIQLGPDTLAKIVFAPGARVSIYATAGSRPADSTLTSNYNTYIGQLNDWYVRYWYRK